MIIPDTDVNLATEVRDVLLQGGGKVTDYLVSFFTTDANINMWSKYKPVVHPKLFYSLDQWKGINGWEDDPGWRGFDKQCGLTIPSLYGSMNSFHSLLDSGEALWTYTPPKGGSTEPMRLGDFRGYNPDAINPIGDIVTAGISQGGDYNVEGTVEFSVDVATNLENNLEYGDIFVNEIPLTEYYLGIYATNGTTWRYKTNSYPLSDQYDFTVSLPLTTGKWTVIPFFCSVAQEGSSSSSGEQVGRYIGANIPAKVFQIISDNEQLTLTVIGTWNSTKTAVQNISLHLENKTNNSVVVDKIGISLRGTTGNTDVNVGNPQIIYYKGASSNTITVPANSAVSTEEGDFASITLGDKNHERFYLNATAYVGDNLYSHIFEIEDAAPEE